MTSHVIGAAQRRRRTLVAIHGVGLPKPGEIIDELTDVEGGRTPLPKYYRAELKIGDYRIPSAETAEEADFQRLIEVNWSDVGRPSGRLIGVLRHLVLLMLAMLRAQTRKPTAEDILRWPSRAYRAAFEGVLLWCIWPIVTTLLVTTFENVFLKGLVLCIVAGTLAVSTYWLRTYSTAAVAGYLWAAMSVLLGISSWLYGNASVTVAARLYGGGQFVTVALLAIFVALVLAHGLAARQRRDLIMTRIALAHAPLVMLTIAGSLLWFAILAIVPVPESWQRAFSAGIGYDLRAVEHSATWVIGYAIPGLLFVGLAVYLAQRYWRVKAGPAARNWIAMSLVVATALLSIPAAQLLVGFASGIISPAAVGDTNIFEIYANSSTRAIGWTVLGLGPLRILFDVLGDVAFFVVPTNSSLSILQETRTRLEQVLHECRDDDLTVIAYSQGCVIALETLPSDFNGRLITVGSPVDTLYRRFLGYEFGTTRGRRSWSWVNVWREGDYVGGPVQAADGADGPLRRDGGHLYYFKDPEVWDELLSKSKPPHRSQANP